MTLTNGEAASSPLQVKMRKSFEKAFTLIELLVVVAMIAVLLGALTTSVSAARARARVQKATAEVKIITQAILAYENWSRKNGYELPTFSTPVDASEQNLGFLLGKEAAQSGGQIPVMLMAQLQSGNKTILDPWGHPYKIRIKQGTVKAAQGVSLWTGYNLPNYYRLGTGERQ